MSTNVPGDNRRSATTDRYLETIYYIEHEGETARPGRLAEWLGVSPPTVTVSLQRLERDGWVVIADDRSVTLSDRGREAAADVVRRHRIVERWLTDILGLDWATADREAAELSHGMSDLVVDRLDTHLGHPVTCPHGNVVPGRRPPAGRRLVRLVSLDPGARAPIARVSEVAEHDAPHLLSTLDAGGLFPGVEITIGERDGDGGVDLHVDGRRVQIDASVAQAIWVETPATTLG